MLNIEQKNMAYLKELLKDNQALKNQLDAQQGQLDAQQGKIDEILKILNSNASAGMSTITTTTSKGKGKRKEKQQEFYEVSILDVNACHL